MDAAPEAEGPAVARLARFDADQLRKIERAFAAHLAVDPTYVTPDGFSVTPEAGGAMGIHWRGEARIDVETFNRIVAEATADVGREHRWRDRMPEPHGGQARPRKFVRRRRRKDTATTPQDEGED